MTHILSLAAGVLPECKPAEIARAAARAGFSHCGFTVDPENWDAADLRLTKALVADHGLGVLDTEVIWIGEGGLVTADHLTIVEAGAELGAANLLVVSSEKDAGKNAAALRFLCERAAPAGMRVCVEFLKITAIDSLDAAADVVRRADHPAAGLLIDTLHFRRAGHAPPDLATLDAAWFPYTQICDGNAACEDDQDAYLEDAIDLRSAPGEGELPVTDIIRALPAGIPLSVEVRSKAYRDRYADPVERAQAVRDQSVTYLESAGLKVA